MLWFFAVCIASASHLGFGNVELEYMCLMNRVSEVCGFGATYVPSRNGKVSLDFRAQDACNR